MNDCLISFWKCCRMSAILEQRSLFLRLYNIFFSLSTRSFSLSVLLALMLVRLPQSPWGSSDFYLPLSPKAKPMLWQHKVLGTKICLNYHLQHHISPQILNIPDFRVFLGLVAMQKLDMCCNQGITDSGQHSYRHSASWFSDMKNPRGHDSVPLVILRY